MNEKMTAILLGIIADLKKLKWNPGDSWEITFKGEGYVPMLKQIVVSGNNDDKSWTDEVSIQIHLLLTTDDQITYFPRLTIYGNIQLGSIESKDIAYWLDCDVAFTEKDVRNEKEINNAAERIDLIVTEYVTEDYQDYCYIHADEIKSQKSEISELRNIV